MKMEKVRVEIEGLTPLLMNRLVPEDLQRKTKKTTKVYDFDEDAKKSAYIAQVDGKQTLYIPSEAVFRCTINTAKFYKTGKLRASRILAGSMRIEPDKIPLNSMSYEVDVRPVVVQRARVLRARAKVPKWKVLFDIVFDRGTIDNPTFIKEILEEAGMKSGLLDFRPERGGSFGTFVVNKFEWDTKRGSRGTK